VIVSFQAFAPQRAQRAQSVSTRGILPWFSGFSAGFAVSAVRKRYPAEYGGVRKSRESALCVKSGSLS